MVLDRFKACFESTQTALLTILSASDPIILVIPSFKTFMFNIFSYGIVGLGDSIVGVFLAVVFRIHA